MSDRPSLVLLRGLPGSGKSTLAAVLSEGGKYPVYSVDDHFTSSEGKYEFVFSENHIAYKKCEENVRKAMSEKVRKIFLANTFTMDWEMEPYFELAKENQYDIFVVTVENYHGSKNVHEIPDDQLTKMAEKYKIKLL